MAGFGKSFERSFGSGLEKGVDMAQERLRARLRREEKEDDRKYEIEQIGKNRNAVLKNAGVPEEKIKEFEGTSLDGDAALESLNTMEQMKLDEKQRALDETGILIGSVEAAAQAGKQLVPTGDKLEELKSKLGLEEPKSLREKMNRWVGNAMNKFSGVESIEDRLKKDFAGTRTAGYTGKDYRDVLNKSGYDAEEDELLRQAATMPKYMKATEKARLAKENIRFKNEYESYQRELKDSIMGFNTIGEASAEGLREAREALKGKMGISMHPREVGYLNPLVYYQLLEGAIGSPTKKDFEWGGKVFDVLNTTGPTGLEKLFRGRDITEQHIRIIEAISKETGTPLTREEILRAAGKKEVKKSKRKRFKFKAF